jgi:hypothetical protein
LRSKETPTNQKSSVHIASKVWSTIPTKIQVRVKVLSAYIGDEDAASKFAQIARAYEVLSDETKR